MSREPAYLSVLRSWARANGIDATKVLELPGITRVDHMLEYQVLVGEGRDAIRAPRRTKMTVPPTGVLMGLSYCGHMNTIASNTDLPAVTRPPAICRIDVDPVTSAHPGRHKDPAYPDATWYNGFPGYCPYRNYLPDVAGLPPLEQHAQALASLDRRAGMPGAGDWQGDHDLEGLAGRRRILERHAPGDDWPNGKRLCSHCGSIPGADVEFWPDADYLDAAAGLVAGLEHPNAS